MNNYIYVYKKISKLCLFLVVCIGFTLTNSINAYAQTFIVDVPSKRTIRGVETPYLIGRASIPNAHVGASCEVFTTVSNDTSIHAESDLLVRTGTSSYVLKNVERANGVTTQNSQMMQLSETITIHIVSIDKLGFSANAVIEITCPDEQVQKPLPPSPAPIQEPEQQATADPDTTPSVQLPVATGPLPRTGPASIIGLFFSSSIISAYLHRRFRK